MRRSLFFGLLVIWCSAISGAQQLYTRNGLEPGFIPHAEYVKFMHDFGADTAAFLKDSGVIR